MAREGRRQVACRVQASFLLGLLSLIGLEFMTGVWRCIIIYKDC
jgi:hypothetical protein